MAQHDTDFTQQRCSTAKLCHCTNHSGVFLSHLGSSFLDVHVSNRRKLVTCKHLFLPLNLLPSNINNTNEETVTFSASVSPRIWILFYTVNIKSMVWIHICLTCRGSVVWTPKKQHIHNGASCGDLYIMWLCIVMVVKILGYLLGNWASHVE